MRNRQADRKGHGHARLSLCLALALAACAPALPSPTHSPVPASPTSPPTQTPEATVAPAAACQPEADWLKARLDLDQSGHLRQALGCPVEAPRAVFLGYQLYLRGQMVWREDTRHIYVLLTDGAWSIHADTWDATQPESGYHAPPPKMIEPKRGFGKVWRDRLGGPEAAIGWAVADEFGIEGQWQTLQNGDAIGLGRYGVLIVLKDGSWR